jgi:hypothetical protein
VLALPYQKLHQKFLSAIKQAETSVKILATIWAFHQAS